MKMGDAVRLNLCCSIAVTFTFISGGLIPLVVSLLEIIRNNMFAAVTFATVSLYFCLSCVWPSAPC